MPFFFNEELKANAFESHARGVLNGDWRIERILKELREAVRGFDQSNASLTLYASISSFGSFSCGFPTSSSDGMWKPGGCDFWSFRLETKFGPREDDVRNVASARLGELLMRDIDKQFVALTSEGGTRNRVLRDTILLCDSRESGELESLVLYLRLYKVLTNFVPELVYCNGVEWSGLKHLLETRTEATFLVERSLVKRTTWPIPSMEYGLVVDPAVSDTAARRYKSAVAQARETVLEQIIVALALLYFGFSLLRTVGQLVTGW